MLLSVLIIGYRSKSLKVVCLSKLNADFILAISSHNYYYHADYLGKSEMISLIKNHIFSSPKEMPP